MYIVDDDILPMKSFIRERFEYFSHKNAYTIIDNDNTKTRTFGELMVESEDLIPYLKTFPPNICVGVYMRNNPCVPSLFFSLLQCNIAFIFLDPDKDEKLNGKIILDLKLYMVITCNFEFTIFPWAKRQFETEFGCQLNFYSYPNQDYHKYENICYIVQTSGTLGEKKYVFVTEQCIISNINSLRIKFNVTDNDVIYFGTPFTFDPSMVELLLGMTSGACLMATSKEIKMKPDTLLKTLFPRHGIGVTVMQMCPSVFLQWSDYEIHSILNRSTLKVLALGGEPFPKHLFKFGCSSNLKLFNLYGITEVSCWGSVCEIIDDVHLGEVLDETIFEVRDSNGTTIDEGEGVLFIGSMTRICYIKDEVPFNINEPVFRSTGDIVHVKDGIYRYKGRSNSIIKRLGHRICLLDLENQITESIKLICKCIWHFGLQKISAFILVPDYKEIKKNKIIDKIRVKLLKDLDSIYFPDNIDLLHEFPLTDNGKIDMNNLEIMGVDSLTKECTEKSAVIFRSLWCKYFGLSKDELEARKKCTFVEMGGTSILKMQFTSELEQLLKSNFNINTIIDHSFEHICDALEEHSATEREVDSGIFQIKWKYYLHACVDTTATVFTKSGEEFVAVGNFANIFVVLDANTGVVKSQIWLPDVVENSCKIGQNHTRIFVGAFNGIMYCLDATTCEILWQFKTNDRIKNVGCQTINKTTLTFGSYDKHIYSVNIENGELFWAKNFHEPITSDMVCCKQQIYVAGIHGTIGCLNESNGHVLWKYKAKNPIFAPLQIFDEQLLIINDVCGHIYCFQNEKLNWIHEPKSASTMYSSALIYKNKLIYGRSDKNVYMLRFSAEKCSAEEVIGSGHDVSGRPAVMINKNGLFVVIVMTDGFIFLYKYEKPILKFVECMLLKNQSFTAPSILDNKLYVGCRDNNLYCININV